MFSSEDISSGQVTDDQIRLAGLPDSDLNNPGTGLYIESCSASDTLNRQIEFAGNRRNTGGKH